MRTKMCQVNTQEVTWEGFILAVDAASAAPLLCNAVLAASGRNHDVVLEAWETNRTIVTADGSVFADAIRRFQSPPQGRLCRDLWGLLIIPEADADRQAAVKIISGGLPVLPGVQLYWPGAGLLNLYTRPAATGELEIRRFERCIYCDSTMVINELWNDWYYSLLTVARGV